MSTKGDVRVPGRDGTVKNAGSDDGHTKLHM